MLTTISRSASGAPMPRAELDCLVGELRARVEVAHEMRAHPLAGEGVPPVLRQAQLGGQRRVRGELTIQTGQVAVLGGGGDAPLVPL